MRMAIAVPNNAGNRLTKNKALAAHPPVRDFFGRFPRPSVRRGTQQMTRSASRLVQFIGVKTYLADGERGYLLAQTKTAIVANGSIAPRTLMATTAERVFTMRGIVRTSVPATVEIATHRTRTAPIASNPVRVG